MFSLVFSLAFLFLALMAVGIGVLKGRKYTWHLSAARIIVLVLSVIVSIAISALIAWFGGGALIDIIKDAMAGNQLSNLMELIPTLPALVRAIIAAVVASSVFVPVLLIVKGIANRCASVPIAKLLLKIGKKKDEQTVEAEATAETAEAAEQTAEAEEAAEVVEVKMSKKQKRFAPFKSTHKFDALGAALGAVCSLFFVIAFLSPFVGNMSLANNAVKMAAGSPDKMIATVVEISDAAAENAGAKTVRVLGGGLIYKGLTTYPVNGEVVSMDKEVKLVGSFVSALSNISNNKISNKEKADSLRDVCASFEEAKVVPMIMSDLLSAAADDWSQGKEFCDIPLPPLGEQFDPVVIDFVVVMKDSNYETVSEDISTMLKVVALLVEHDAIESTKGDNGGLGMFENEELVSAVMLEFLNNERLSSLSTSMTNVAISLFADNLNMLSDNEALYNGFIDDMAVVYEEVHYESNNDHKVEWLATEIYNIYDRYGMSISKGVAHCIAIDMIDDESVTDKEGVKNFFAPHKHTVQPISASGSVEVSYIASSKTEERDALEFIDAIIARTNKDMSEEELKAIVAEELCKLEIADDLSADDIEEISAEIAEELIEDIQNESLNYKKAEFADAKAIGEISEIVTADELKISAKNITDKEKEAHALANIFKKLLILVEDVTNFGSSDVERIIVDLGPVFDAFSDSETVGGEVAKHILIGTLQSKTVIKNTGLTVASATDIARTMTDGKANGESYTTLMKSLGKTVEIIRISGESGDTTAAVTELMKELTPTSSKTLQTLSTPDMVKEYGVSDQSAKPVADMFSDMFGNMSKVTEEKDLTDEEYEKEAQAVNDMMNIAMSASQSNGKKTFGKGEDSATGITAEEFVNRATESVVVTETLVNSVYEGGEEAKSDPLATGEKLSQQEQTEMVEALDAKWKAQLASSNDATANEECKKQLTAIAAVVNLEIAFDSDSVVAVG